MKYFLAFILRKSNAHPSLFLKNLKVQYELKNL